MLQIIGGKVMDSEIVLVSDEVNQELVEMPIGVYDNENVVIDSFEVSSSSMDLETQVTIETETEQEQQLMEEHLYAVVCTGPNGEIVEEVTVEAHETLEEPVNESYVEIGPSNGSFMDETAQELIVKADEAGEVMVIEADEDVVNETAELMVNEADELMVNEADEDIVNEADENMVNETAEVMVNETAEVMVNEEDEVMVNEEDEDIVNEADEDMVNETAEVMVNEEDEDIVNEADEDMVNEQQEDVANEQQEDVVNVQQEDMVNEQQEDVVNEQQEDVVNETAEVMVNETAEIMVNEPGNMVSDAAEEISIEPVDETVNELVDETVNEPVLETVNESVDEPVLETHFEPVVETVIETHVEAVTEPLAENFDVSETVVSGTLENPAIEIDAESVELVSEVSVKEPDSEFSTELVSETVEEGSCVGAAEGSPKVDGEVMTKAESVDGLNGTVVSTAGEADSTLDATALSASADGQAEDDGLIIDTSKPIELKVDAIMWINNHKCIIQKHPENSGELVAYPVHERTTKKKPRGRPRKLRPPSAVEEETEVEEKPKAEIEDKTEKGFVQMADASGAVVKRSARKRKRASHLDEYETGMVGAASDNEDQSVAEDDDDYSKMKASVGYSLRGRGVRGRGRGRASAQVANGGRGRGRGRPRRYNIEPEKVEVVQKSKPAKPQPQQQQQQAYLVQMADGRTVVIQVPVTGLAEGMTSQSLAMSVAEALSSGQSSGVLNISVQRGTGNAVTTEKIVEIKKEGSADDKKNEQAPAAQAAATTTTTAVTTAPPTLIPLTVVPPKAEPATQIGLKTSDADLAKYRCSKCDFQGYYLQQQQDHLLSAHSDVVIRCRCCSHVTLLKPDLVDHFKEKHPKCICSTCNFMVDQPFAMRRHMQRHITTGTTCHICGKTYKDRYILRIHMRMVHMPAKILFECPLCTKKFNRKAHLVRHLRTHNPAKPYKCSKCDYRGSERSDVTKHSLIHEEPKHVCEVCGHNFRHLRNKEIHLKRHSGQKDYKCGVCDFYGYTFTEIRKHISRKHSSDPNTRPCMKCGQAFLNDLQLAEHHMTGQCEANTQEEALLATEDLPLEDDNEMEVDNIATNGEQASIQLSEDTLSVVVNSSELMDMKGDEEEEEVLSSGAVDVNCEPPTISLVSDGVEFDGSHGLLTLLSEDGQVIRGIILDSGELETQVENTVVLEEVT